MKKAFIIAVICLVYLTGCDISTKSAFETIPETVESVSWMDSFENSELVEGKKYVVKDVREIEIIYGPYSQRLLGYNTYLILEEESSEPVNINERIIFEYISLDKEAYEERMGDISNIFEDIDYEGKDYMPTLLVPGDIIVYIGNGEFECVQD